MNPSYNDSFGSFGVSGGTGGSGSVISSGGDSGAAMPTGVASGSGGISSGVGGGIVLASGGKKSKKWILAIAGVLVVVAVVVAVVLIGTNRKGKGSTESLKTPYWTYMNYLIRGRESDEALSEDDYPNSETVVRKKFEGTDSGYFVTLKDLFENFEEVFSAQAEDFKSRYEESISGYAKTLDFIVGLKTTGVPEGEDEYIENKAKLEELQTEYREIVAGMGCLIQNEINEDCLFSKTPTEEMNDVLAEIGSVSKEIEIAEDAVVDSLLQQSWGMQNMIKEDRDEE